ncbi:hypothetical protein Y032_0063g3418 [Ancylostoma ceylanicum]|uniref:Uncharacterized protein n=1 Tax=Ancylostoma ceylanicum TaxID=53326 RepID=A0A016U1B0_9BILA|nr:hypothetical protein Y032_0063g3418 [Ancylostoma ceylanicum]
MASVIDFSVDYVTMRGAGCRSWFADLVLLGFAFINPTPGGREVGLILSTQNQVRVSVEALWGFLPVAYHGYGVGPDRI